MKMFLIALVVSVAVLAACSSNDTNDGTDGATTTEAAAPQPGPATVADLAALFRDAVNSRDAAAVVALAPDTNETIADFLIGGGPYESVSCEKFAGQDACRMVNGIADFSFVVDVTSGLVSEVTYVGGE